MPFTVAELENISNAVIDYHMRDGVKSQTIQEKPLLAALRGKAKTFPNGKDNITFRVKGQYTTTLQGFEHDDAVSYANPANIRTGSVPWKLLHAGINFSMHELLKVGISIVDTATGEGENNHSGSERQILANLLDDKIEDMMEGMERGFQTMYWRDGTQDAKAIPGITSFILDDPTSATVVAGIDQSANTWWRNRASLAIANTTAAAAADQNLVTKLQSEFRQLRRYGGRPDLFLAGSAFIEQLERELRAKGNYTLEGWATKKAIDISVADVNFKGLTIQYDPTLDDLSKSKYGYVLDTRTIYPMVMSGEDMKKHNPARPENKYVFYRAMTYVGGLICNQRNANGVYSIA